MIPIWRLDIICDQGTMACQQVDQGEGVVSLRMFSCVLRILNENGEFNIHKLIIRIHTFDRSWLCQCYCIPWYQLETTPPSEHSTKHWFNKEEACQMGPIVSPLCSVCLWNVRSLWWKPFTQKTCCFCRYDWPSPGMDNRSGSDRSSGTQERGTKDNPVWDSEHSWHPSTVHWRPSMQTTWSPAQSLIRYLVNVFLRWAEYIFLICCPALSV